MLRLRDRAREKNKGTSKVKSKGQQGNEHGGDTVDEALGDTDDEAPLVEPAPLLKRPASATDSSPQPAKKRPAGAEPLVSVGAVVPQDAPKTDPAIPKPPKGRDLSKARKFHEEMTLGSLPEWASKEFNDLKKQYHGTGPRFYVFTISVHLLESSWFICYNHRGSFVRVFLVHRVTQDVNLDSFCCSRTNAREGERFRQHVLRPYRSWQTESCR